MYRQNRNFLYNLQAQRARFNSKLAQWRLNGDFVLMLVPVILFILLLGQTIVMLPFRLFTVTLHEAGHAIAALLMGDGVGQLVISPISDSFVQIGPTGQVQTIIIYSAGYLGSTWFGGTLLFLAKRPQARRKTLFGLIIGLFLLIILFARNPSAAFILMLIIEIAAVAVKGSDAVVAFCLYVLALLSCFNSMHDVIYLIYNTHAKDILNIQTDAASLEIYTHVPAVTWALSWSFISAAMLAFFVTSTLVIPKPRLDKRSDNNSKPQPQPSPSYPYTYTVTPLKPDEPPLNFALITPPPPQKPSDDAVIASLLARYDEDSAKA